ncbi:MAG: cyclic nucleotide-binding protein [Desulfuromonas sp.]|nr:MAG: cyclic nucleotide-binding protein [Desulfuromonas sp.]
MGLIRHLRDTEPFSSLPEDILQEITDSVVEKTFPADSWVCREEQPPTGYLYIIKEGLVEISVLTPGGVDMVVDYRENGAFFGGTPVFTGQPYSASARTASDTICYLVPEDVLKKAEGNFPLFSSYFTRIVLSRVRKLYTDIVSEHTTASVTQMEAFPFKKRLSEIMSTPATSCRPDASAQKVAREMTESNETAVIVTDENGDALGIITENDIVRKVVAPGNIDCNSITAQQIMTAQPYSLPPGTYMYEAMAYMIGHNIKHLPVITDGKAVGMVSLHELMRYRSQKAMMLLGTIREQTTIDGLRSTRKEIIKVARSLLSETRSTPEAMEILSYIHHGIIRRAFEICLNLQTSESGPAPNIRYCFLIMGSGGRREMLLNPDQDNGFIFENFPDKQQPEVDRFFIPLAEKIVNALSAIGYDLCSGKVMANNPAWRGRVSDWEERIGQWAFDPEPVHIRNSSIFFDFAPLFGDVELVHDLRESLNQIIADNPQLLYQMMALDIRHKTPIGLLGRFVVEKSGPHKNMLSLKLGGTVFLTDCIRMFALEEGLQEISTLKRLEALVERNVFAADTAEHLRASYEALNYLRLRHEIALLETGEPSSHFINPNDLSKTEQDLLKESFHAVSKLQDATKRHFSHSPF